MPVAASATIPFNTCPTCIGGGGAATVVALTDLTDVQITAPLTAGTSLVWDGTQFVNSCISLDDLCSVDAAAPTAGQTIIWDPTANAGAGGYVLGNAAGASTLDGLTDVAAAGATAGQTIIFDPAANAGAGGFVLGQPPHGINDHTDADTVTNLPTDNQVLTWDPTALAGVGAWVPEDVTATCNLRELGGVAGVLAVGDGLGVPNPMQTGYTLSADRVVGVVTTPPAGGNDVFEVRLMPGSTVITTGTIVDTQSVAAFSPFADLAVTTGQWVEVVVTAVSAGTPSSELTVVGELCGPGTPTAAGAAPITEVGEGNTLPADDSSGELFRLINSVTAQPDGLYMWQGTAWVQVG